MPRLLVLEEPGRRWENLEPGLRDVPHHGHAEDVLEELLVLLQPAGGLRGVPRGHAHVDHVKGHPDAIQDPERGLQRDLEALLDGLALLASKGFVDNVHVLHQKTIGSSVRARFLGP